MRARRLWTVACALILAFGVTACGHKQAHPTVADANNNGGYVDAGPITYQLQISRVLNPYSTEDSQYVKGLPPGTTPPTPDQQWYGVFLWAKNQTDARRTSPPTGSTSSTPRATRTTRSSSNPTSTRTPGRRRRWRPLQIEPGARHHGRLRSHPGRAAAVQDRQLGLRQPPADAQRSTAAARPATISLDLGVGASAGRRSGARLDSAAVQGGGDHVTRRRRGGRASEAGVGKQRADDDPGVPGGRVADEPGVGVLRGVRARRCCCAGRCS